MSDDLDERLRAAMKTLDAEVPSGYFDALPTRTLARLEGNDMQTQGTSSSTESSTGIPPQREEDSGLHDIRSLASSTKMRISKRVGTVPPPQDDILASSSAGWKAVALPEPAKMVSLPELADLPSAREIKERDKAAKKAAKESAKREAKAEPAAAAAVTASASSSASLRAPTYLDENEKVDIAPAPAVSKPAFGANITQQKRGNKGAMIAVVGLGLAAAAGGAFFLMNSNKDKQDAAPAAAPEPVAVAAPVEPPAPPPAPPVVEEIKDEPKADEAVAAAAVPEVPDEPEPAAARAKAAPKKGKKEHAVEIDLNAGKAADKPKKEAPVEVKKPVKKEESSSDPSFDALLKEAGVDGKKENKPILDKKSLSGADIKNGMGAVAGKAKACYAGEQGTAAVKLTVAPSGAVQKVTVTGQFKGTPVGACVEAAVKSATFPPWDGGPQSFNFSYLLAE